MSRLLNQLFIPVFATGNKYLQTVNISGTGSIETDYIIPMILHRGSQSGDYTNKDIFLDGKCKLDFSDIHFTDGNDVPLSHYLHGAINAETIQDSSIGDTNIIKANGTIVSSNYGQIAESSDNAKTWTILYESTGAQIIWVDPITDLYFVSTGYLLKRSDAAHTTWTTVLDMTTESGVILPYGFCENAAGVLFAGRYQATNAAEIFRSVDGGENWVSIYEVNGDANSQHIHGLGVDPTTGYLYAGVDGSTPHTIRSINPTEAAPDFTDINGMDAIQFAFGDGWRSFNGEVNRPSTITRTADDVTFTPESVRGQCCRVLRNVGNNLYGSLTSQNNYHYCQIIQRDNSGIWRTFWITPYETSTSNVGPRWADQVGTPAGASPQLLMSSTLDAYKPLRLFDGGGHYQSLVYVCIPSLPAAGTTIKIYSKSGNASSVANTFPANFSQTGLLAQYKLDEGTGTTITDSSGNGKAAVLTPGTGSWNSAGGRMAGAANPDITLAGKSYHFNGDGKIIIIDSDTDEAFNFTNVFTICAWFRTLSTANQYIVCKGTMGGQHWALTVNGTPRFAYNTDTILGLGQSVYDGRWHFMAISIDANNKYISCVDGNCTALTSLAAPIAATAGLVSIGADASGEWGVTTGDVDDVQIYNEALTAVQMRQIYESRSFATLEPAICYPAQNVIYDGAATAIDCGNHASVVKLHDNAMTVEGWFNPTSTGEGGLGEFICKRGGWGLLYANSANVVSAAVVVSTTSSTATGAITPDTGWHHVAFTYDDAGDRKSRLFIDGVLAGTGLAAVGNAVTDETYSLMIGNIADAARHFTGSIGWVRISNNIRYNFAFSPPPRQLPPASDANTVRLYKMDEGTGTDIADSSANNQHGTLASGTWAVA